MKKIITAAALLCLTYNIQAQQKIAGNSQAVWKIFWQTFKQRVLAHDSIAVANMVAYPFTDGNTVYKGNDGFTSNTHNAFLKNYSQIFTPHVIEAIKNDTYRTFAPGKFVESGGDQIKKGEYMLQPSTDAEPQYYDIIFKKVKGVYKLTGTAYYQ